MYLRFLALAIAVMLAISACYSKFDRPNGVPPLSLSPDRADCRIVGHVMGETKVCGQPQRIAAIGPYVLEPLLALNVRPVGFADHLALHQGEYTNPSQQIPYLGQLISPPLANLGTAYAPSIEAILKVKPDLILGVDGSQYEILSKIAPTLILKWDDPQMSLKAIARAVDRCDRAEQLLRETSQRLAAARRDFAPVVAAFPRVLLLSSDRLQDIYLGNSGHGFCSSLLEELGFQLVAPANWKPDPQTPLIPISLETLPELDRADRVILLGHGFSGWQGNANFERQQLADLKQAWSKNAIAQSLKTSKNGRISFIPAYLCLGLPGPIGTELYLNELKKQLSIH